MPIVFPATLAVGPTSTSGPIARAGDLIEAVATFTNAATPPVPADPTGVAFAWSVVDEATRQIVVASASYPIGDGAIVKDSTGVYHVWIDTTGAPGLLLWRFTGTGWVEQVWNGQLVIRKV
jgi:hypothetical protein